METTIRSNKSKKDTTYREAFEAQCDSDSLKVYVKSKGVIYDVVVAGEAVCEKEEFCAGKFTFYVIKDDIVSFNQGDAVSVKYKNEGIFYGYVFSKSRDRENLIKVMCYDQLRYLKNRRTYTRGRMSLEEAVRDIVHKNNLRIKECDSCDIILSPVAAENVSLLDVIKRACGEVRRISGRRFMLYDDFGGLCLRDEAGLECNVLIDESGAENFIYSDSIDSNVYNTIELYHDTKRANLRELTMVSDEKTREMWGTLILSKRADDYTRAYEEGKKLLDEYNRINREIVLKNVSGDTRLIPGASVYVKLVMGDLYFDGYVRCRRAVHMFKNNLYSVDLYLDGSDYDEPG